MAVTKKLRLSVAIRWCQNCSCGVTLSSTCYRHKRRIHSLAKQEAEPNDHSQLNVVAENPPAAVTPPLGGRLEPFSCIIADSLGYKTYTIATFISLASCWTVGSASSSFGSYIFNLEVAGHLYDKEASKQMEDSGRKREAGKELNCSGGQEDFTKAIYREEAEATEADGVVPSGETEARAKVGANAGRGRIISLSAREQPKEFKDASCL
ncbi:hypothetical protein SADUNF_Sadunf02G0112900 [Salix dunnii]|uniref:C2H2-type domain-containing protein n=1 Tax=Salix dunnii TaxID=1413687 RepID=A0A835N785_9ROSI|nr:hypothetical protein SADUNF_Sadunf02G0112900 [Salix dunnii]